MDEKQVSDFLFEMSDKARETTRNMFGRDRFYEGVASGINVAATTIKMRMYDDFKPEECVDSALVAVSMADVVDSVLNKEDSDD